MKLIDALKLLQKAPRQGIPYRVYLASGFTPLHLQTFLAAHLIQLCPREPVEVLPGLFGDLAGNLERVDAGAVNAVVVAMEWGDLDPRLGVRSLGGWKPDSLGGILDTAAGQLGRIGSRLEQMSLAVPVVVSLPTLPLPPVSFGPSHQESDFELQLRESLGAFAVNCRPSANIKIVSSQSLALASPLAERFDFTSELQSGFPYRAPHASLVAERFAALLRGPRPMKGLITDLDDTVWSGILGEAGVDGVHWSLEFHSHIHGLYQQMLESVAATGVLLAVASKNDPDLVKQAFGRKDILLHAGSVFPFEVNWGPKSESVERILKAWNIGAEAVLFVDDSPMELAEVGSAFPEMQCLAFPRDDPDEFWRFLGKLRQAFGKTSISTEDSIRIQSLRGRRSFLESAPQGGVTLDAFLETSGARIIFELTRNAGDERAFDLINKTNQFNLNGERLSVSAWSAILCRPDSFLLAVTYQDKFGPLGKIAAALGTIGGGAVHIESWVMSCRAFSRRIEHQTLRHLFDKFDADTISLAFRSTPRNGPLQDFLTPLFSGSIPPPPVVLTRSAFAAKCPRLFHVVEERQPAEAATQVQMR
jgi:FkbH-like protein